MRVWRCFIKIMRSYLKLCILVLSILFCYGNFNSIIYIISAITLLLEMVKFIILHVLTLTL
jgi:hypothetical protein